MARKDLSQELYKNTILIINITYLRFYTINEMFAKTLLVDKFIKLIRTDIKTLGRIDVTIILFEKNMISHDRHKCVATCGFFVGHHQSHETLHPPFGNERGINHVDINNATLFNINSSHQGLLFRGDYFVVVVSVCFPDQNILVCLYKFFYFSMGFYIFLLSVIGWLKL